MSEEIDKGRRRFLTTATSVIGGIGAACVATPFVAAWHPSAKAQALGAPVEVDVSRLDVGAQLTVAWRGQPIWVVRRSQEMLNMLAGQATHLRDPNSEESEQPVYTKNEHRSIKPEWLVLVGLCTHLGCVPTYRPDIGGVGPDWPGGFYCPCHGSKYDLAGRVYTGVPAPTNLIIPPHRYLSETTILIGEDEEVAA